MKKILIIGYGRFGELLCELLKKDFKISVYEENRERSNRAKLKDLNILNDLEDLNKFSYIFICVPISTFKDIILRIKDKTNKEQIVLDVCSVKSYPSEIMTKYLKNAQTVATHPLFGPDSFSKKLELKIVVCRLNINDKDYSRLIKYFEKIKLQIIETTPNKHDHDIIYSQAFTYIILNLIQNMNFPKIDISTPSYLKLKEITEISENDTKQLFIDMIKFNPYFNNFYKRLKKGYKSSLDNLKMIYKK